MFGWGVPQGEPRREQREERILEREGVDPMTARTIAVQDNAFNPNLAGVGRQILCDAYGVTPGYGMQQAQFPMAGFEGERRREREREQEAHRMREMERGQQFNNNRFGGGGFGGEHRREEGEHHHEHGGERREGPKGW